VRIGLDFDNTIVCYNDLFPRLAREKGLIAAGGVWTKNSLRDHLRKTDREDSWTELQGEAYGVSMGAAKPYAGSLEFIRFSRSRRAEVYVVSHKTKYPFSGPKTDLHRAADDWIEALGFYDPAAGLARDNVFFELTKEEKLGRIGTLRCDFFVDDLPEFLEEADFPSGVQRILFDPADSHGDSTEFKKVRSWNELRGVIFALEQECG